MLQNLDIRTFVQVALAFTILFILLAIWAGIRSIRGARELKFFRMRRERSLRGWRLLILAVILVGVAIFLNSFAEPIAYRFFPPTATASQTPTITLTPTISLTPTITLSPTITNTPSETNTPTITPTPFLPLGVQVLFEGTLTPAPDAVFSPLVFTQGINEEDYTPLAPGEVFQNPVGHLYAVFSYDQMIDGVQWSALWWRGDELVYYETEPWAGGTGGFGYTDWEPDPAEWLPGVYQVQIFAGLDWRSVGFFTVEGESPTAEPSLTPTSTVTETPSMTSTRTPHPTATPVTPTLTRTPWPTATPPTPTITRTPWPSVTPQPTRTPRPTATPITPTATYTRRPSATPITPTPTLTRWPSPTRTPTP